MKKLFRLNNEGFSHIEIGLVVIVALVLGLIGYSVYKNTSHAGSGYSGWTQFSIQEGGSGNSVTKTSLAAVAYKIPAAIEQACPNGQEVAVASQGNGPYTVKPCVKKLQFILNNYLGITNTSVNDPVDGEYGPKTQATVDAFAAKWNAFASANNLSSFDKTTITNSDFVNVLDKLEAKKTSSVSFYACSQSLQNSGSVTDYIFRGKVVDTSQQMSPNDNVYMVDLPANDWSIFKDQNSWLNQSGVKGMLFDYAGVAVNMVNAEIHLTNGVLAVAQAPVQWGYDLFSAAVWAVSLGNVHLGGLGSYDLPTFHHPVNNHPNYITVVHGIKYVQTSNGSSDYASERIGDTSGGTTGFVKDTLGTSNYIGMVYLSGDGKPVYTNLVLEKNLKHGCN